MKVRLQRFMADCGVASRRECEEMIVAGRVRVNGVTPTRLPVLIDPAKDKVMLDEENVEALKPQKVVYFLLNKPKSVLVTNSDPDDRKTAIELMKGVEERVFPVGRLDMDSRGALIMTNDGELANRLTHPRFGVEKTYIVEVDGKMTPGEIEKVKRGMWLGGDEGGRGIRTDRFHIKILGRERGRTVMEVIIAEGKNREIRRVMARIGHTVRDLNRVAIGGKVTIKGLDPGEFRPLTESEIAWLWKVSSPEYHDRERQATQQWYEQKEAEKERKRLEKEAAAAKERESYKPRTPAIRAAEPERKRKDYAKPFTRVGKKPFVPPSGRNAGKILGGSKKNRKALEKQLYVNDEFSVPETPASQTPRMPKQPDSMGFRHPLGDAASESD